MIIDFTASAMEKLQNNHQINKSDNFSIDMWFKSGNIILDDKGYSDAVKNQSITFTSNSNDYVLWKWDGVNLFFM